ncbi:MAG: glycosylase [Clostridia bacterium]|nr:glycosylase [Clostridia bacterium]
MKDWLKTAVFYEIYPQSFKDTNADGIGDFNGIIEKLDYIKSVGFNAIWLNPCYKSPFNDAGYDVTDYYTVAERYGTNEDLKRLFYEAHTRGMHIILDLVPGHTSLECEWFIQSQKATPNEYSGRYIWTDSVWTDVTGISGITGSYRGLSERDGSCAVNFFTCQPALNYGFAKVTEPWQSSMDSPEALQTRTAMIDVIKFWIGMGCDGFRVDMAGSLVKNDDEEQSATVRLWQEIFAEVKKHYPEAVFVSEWGEPDRALCAGFDMDFLLHFGSSHYMDLFRTDKPYFSYDGRGNLEEFFKSYLENLKKTMGNGYICIPSGNHDMERISRALDNEQIKLAFAFLMSMPGIPFVYYGDEIGMKYLKNIASVEGGYYRTGARTPMQWDTSSNCGFSAASPNKLYIAIDPDEGRPTVEEQMLDDTSVLNELKRIITVRHSCKELGSDSDFELISCGYPLLYRRGKKVLVAINPTQEEKTVECSAIASEIIYSYNGGAVLEDGKITVKPASVAYIRLEN